MTDPHIIIGLGEVLWDVFESGKTLGGAPTNFAYHAARLGHQGTPLCRVGEDRLGDEIVSAIEDLGLPAGFLQRDPEHPTGTAPVKLDADGTPTFTIVEDVAWDYMEPDERWLELAASARAVCFGTLAQRSPQSRRTVQQVLAAAEHALCVCDINFRQRFYTHEVVTESLAAANVLKLNEQEVALLRGVLGTGDAGGDDELLRALMRDYAIELTCVTLGADGCRLLTLDEAVARPVAPTEVVDTVGSGDAFTAGLVVKKLAGAGLPAMAEAANLMGAYVAGRRGATPPVTGEVLERFHAL